VRSNEKSPPIDVDLYILVEGAFDKHDQVTRNYGKWSFLAPDTFRRTGRLTTDTPSDLRLSARHPAVVLSGRQERIARILAALPETREFALAGAALTRAAERPDRLHTVTM
jgi:hypothetical protein